MKQVTTANGLTYDVPESKDDQSASHEGWDIWWEYPPIPYRGMDWAAQDPDDPEAGCIHAPTVAELKELIEETIEERAA